VTAGEGAVAGVPKSYCEKPCRLVPLLTLTEVLPTVDKREEEPFALLALPMLLLLLLLLDLWRASKFKSEGWLEMWPCAWEDIKLPRGGARRLEVMDRKSGLMRAM
jgi:hypothetical protein